MARGYGEANVELRVPASDSTIYQSGSLGKQFTSALVVMLAEEGRLGSTIRSLDGSRMPPSPGRASPFAIS